MHRFIAGKTGNYMTELPARQRGACGMSVMGCSDRIAAPVTSEVEGGARPQQLNH